MKSDVFEHSGDALSCDMNLKRFRFVINFAYGPSAYPGGPMSLTKGPFFVMIFTTLISFSVHAEILKSRDSIKNCDRYQVPGSELEIEALKAAGSEVISQKIIYGFSLENLEIDFDLREIKLDVISKVSFGFNRTLLRDVRVSDSEAIKKYSNLLNHDIMLLRNICVSDQNELIEAE